MEAEAEELEEGLLGGIRVREATRVAVA